MDMDHTVYLALGSNMDNRLANLRQAVASLSPQLEVKKKSRVYETPPWGYEDQPLFLNMAVMAKTYLEPEPLLKHLKRLEAALGRQETFRNGPRLIDIDILFYDALVLQTPTLTIPHPRLHERGFVLAPLMDIAQELEHPVLGKTIWEIIAYVDVKGIRQFA